jgi:AcrR family transcriptional regulator
MQNAVPSALPPGSVAERALLRSLGARQAAYAGEVRRLLDAAFEVMRETGSLDPRVEQIVRAAGLSNQAFYRHFRSKAELLLAVLDDGIHQLHAYLARRMAAAPDGQARVREWLQGMLTQALHPAGAAATRPFALARARLAEQFPGEVEKSETQLTALLREALEQAAADGSLPGADPVRDARTLYDLALGWMQRALAGPEQADESDAEALLGFALGGLRRGA